MNLTIGNAAKLRKIKIKSQDNYKSIKSLEKSHSILFKYNSRDSIIMVKKIKRVKKVPKVKKVKKSKKAKEVPKVEEIKEVDSI